MNKLALLTALAAALCGAATLATAADVGRHPAVPKSGAGTSADAAVVLVGHPARGSTGRAGHANFDHPAVTTHRAGQVARIDTNRYLVQPPATTVWRNPAASTEVAAATR